MSGLALLPLCGECGSNLDLWTERDRGEHRQRHSVLWASTFRLHSPPLRCALCDAELRESGTVVVEHSYMRVLVVEDPR